MPETNLIDSIRGVAKSNVFPDTTSYLSISLRDIQKISEKTNESYRKIEIAALDNHIIPQRYARNMRTFSPEDQSRLLQSSATVVGLGGLGGVVVELLARAGIGKLNLVDGDVFEESNLNRQLLSALNNLGKSKAKTAFDHICQINASIELNYHDKYVDHQNCQSILAGTEIVVDCLDNLKTRFLLEQTTKNMNLPLVYGAVGGYTGQVMTILPEDAGLRKIYGDEGSIPDRGIEATLGTIPPAVFMVASAQCAEVIKVLLKRKNVLSNKLLIMDPFDAVFEILDL